MCERYVIPNRITNHYQSLIENTLIFILYGYDKIMIIVYMFNGYDQIMIVILIYIYIYILYFKQNYPW